MANNNHKENQGNRGKQLNPNNKGEKRCYKKNY